MDLRRIISTNLFTLFIIIFTNSNTSADHQIIKLSFIGDIIIHEQIYNNNLTNNTSYREIFRSLFQNIKPTFSKSDILIGNLEFPISPPYKPDKMKFNCPPQIIPILKKTGFSILSIANNHIMDQGKAGLYSTIKLLKQNKISHVGAGIKRKTVSKGIVRNLKGIKIGIIAYTSLLNENQSVDNEGLHINWLYNRLRVLKDIDNIKSRCDYLIMLVHSGKEYRTTPVNRDKRILKQYINRGVDLIVGNHPHVIQPVEKIITIDNREAYVFYCLGNFVSGKCSEGGLKKIDNIEIYNSSIILNAFLQKKLGKNKVYFNLLPIATIKKNIGPNSKYEVGLINNIINCNVKAKSYLKNEILKLKKTIFEYQKINEIKFKYY